MRHLAMHSGTGQPVKTYNKFFFCLAGQSAPTGFAIVHWIGCINAIIISCQFLTFFFLENWKVVFV